MNRVKTFCPCCDCMVELYSDHLCVAGARYRCGNCFEPFMDDDVEQAKRVHQELQDLDDQRKKIIEQFRRF